MGIVKMKYVTILLVLAVVRGTDAATYVVGDSTGWTIPSGGAATYATWASKHTYFTGDKLVFNFVPGVHDVATVKKSAFDSCSSTSPTSLLTISPANITLSTPGRYYFICTFASHCSLGQKLTVNVISTASPPASSPTAATPPPSAATSPPTATTSPPATSPTMPPTAATSPPATSPTAATSPPATSPTMSPTAGGPTTPPTSTPPAPAPGPSTTPSGEPSTSPASTATPPGVPTSPPPADNTTTSPPPSSASRGAAATLAMGLGLVLFMGVVC